MRIRLPYLASIIFLGCMIVIVLALGHQAWGWL